MNVKTKSVTIKDIVCYCKVCDIYYNYYTTRCPSIGCCVKTLFICRNCAKKLTSNNVYAGRFCLSCFRKKKKVMNNEIQR